MAPRQAYRGLGGSARINFWLADVPEDEEVKVEILDAAGETVREYSTKASGDVSSLLPPGMSLEDIPARFRSQLAGATGKIDVEAGMNQVNWDGRYEPLFTQPRGIVMWGGGGRGGPRAVPGEYTVRMSVGDWSPQYEEQYEFTVTIGNRLNDLWEALQGLRRVKQSMRALTPRVRGQEGAKEVMELGRAITKELEEVEKVITQVEGEGGQDALNFPGRLDNQWASLYGAASGPNTPMTAGVATRYADLQPETDELLQRLQAIYDGQLVELNAKIAAMALDAIVVPGEKDVTEQ